MNKLKGFWSRRKKPGYITNKQKFQLSFSTRRRPGMPFPTGTTSSSRRPRARSGWTSPFYFLALRPLKESPEMFRNLRTEQGKLVEQLRGDARSLVRSKAFVAYLAYQIIGNVFW